MNGGSGRRLRLKTVNYVQYSILFHQQRKMRDVLIMADFVRYLFICIYFVLLFSSFIRINNSIGCRYSC